MQNSSDLGSVFGRAWQLLSTNWVIVVPALVIGIVGGIIVGLLTNASATSLSGAFLVGLLASIISAIAAVLSITYTTGMAGAAWERGTTTFADGSAAFSRSGGSAFVAMLLLIVLGIIAGFLSLVTFGLALAAFMLFFGSYTMASVIVGKRSAPDGLAESCSLAVRNFVPTLIIVLVIFVIGVIGALVGGLFAMIPFLGPIVRLVISQIILAYGVLVFVGEYLRLRPPAAVPSP
jgi:hypothetical protein